VRLLYDALAAGLRIICAAAASFRLFARRLALGLVAHDQRRRAGVRRDAAFAKRASYISSAKASRLVSWRKISGVCATANIRVSGRTPNDLNVTH